MASSLRVCVATQLVAEFFVAKVVGNVSVHGVIVDEHHVQQHQHAPSGRTYAVEEPVADATAPGYQSYHMDIQRKAVFHRTQVAVQDYVAARDGRDFENVSFDYENFLVPIFERLSNKIFFYRFDTSFSRNCGILHADVVPETGLQRED